MKQIVLVIGFFICLLFVLFQGGKLALMTWVMYTIFSAYLLFGYYNGVRSISGARSLGHAEHVRMEAGTALPVKLQFQIPGAWPVPYVIVQERLVRRSDGVCYDFDLSFVPDWKLRGQLEYYTPNLMRGHYSFGQTICTSEDIFGLFQQEGRLEMENAFRIYPQTVPIRYWRNFDRLHRGQQFSTLTNRSPKETTQINGVRDYIYGDRLSRIHWNATARTGTWKSKEFEKESLPKTMIVLDQHRGSYRNQEQFELAVSVAASMLEYASDHQLAFGLTTFGKQAEVFEPRKGSEHLRRLKDHLIDVSSDAPYSITKVLATLQGQKLPGGVFVVVISPTRGDEMLKALLQLQQRKTMPCLIHLYQGGHEVAEQWLSLLHSRGLQGHAVPRLEELPQVLGGGIR